MEVSCRGKTFNIYPINEYMNEDWQGPSVVSDWRQAKKGDWVMTSNDFVIQIISRRKKHPKTHKKPFYLLKSGFGEHPTYKKHIFATKQVNYAENQYKGKELVKNVAATTLQKSFADKISMEFKPDNNGQFSSEDIVNCYMSTYMDNNPTQALRRGTNLLKRKYIKERISMNLRDKLIEQGLSDEFVVEKYREILDGKDTPHNTKLNALNKVSELLGHSIKEKETRSQSIIMISEGDKKLLAQVRKELSDKEVNQLMSKVKKEGIEGVTKPKNSKSVS